MELELLQSPKRLKLDPSGSSNGVFLESAENFPDSQTDNRTSKSVRSETPDLAQVGPEIQPGASSAPAILPGTMKQNSVSPIPQNSMPYTMDMKNIGLAAGTPGVGSISESKAVVNGVQATKSLQSRLVLLAGNCMNRHIIEHLGSLRILMHIPTTEVSVDQAEHFLFAVYTHINICIEYDENFVKYLSAIIQLFNSHKSLFEQVQQVGYHIVFNRAKNWEDYSDDEKTHYHEFLRSLNEYCGDRVTQCSLVGKYDSSTIYITEKDDLVKLREEILEDIAYWKNLKVCDYSENCVRFLPGVKFPESLQVLNIGGGSSLETLTGFKIPTQLKVLNASKGAITSIDYVSFPPILERLDLLENRIFFLNYVDLPPHLLALDLSQNCIDSLKSINFPRNLKYLSVSNNPIECIKGAKFPETIEYLDLSCIPNESMTGIKFPDLTIWLNLQQSMTNTRGLKLPPYVLELNLACNGVNSINPLKLPNSIQKLYLANNNIKTLNKVVFPTALKELYLGNNMITTLKNVLLPPTLEVLDLEMDPYSEDNEKYITSLKDVYFPANLRVLRLGYHLIKAIESMEFPFHLQELNLAYNDLRVLRNVSFGPKLRVLDLSGNQDLIGIDNVQFPESLVDFKIPSLLLNSLPATIVERANKHELSLTKSLPYTI